MGVSLRSSSNDEGSSRVWMALLVVFTGGEYTKYPLANMMMKEPPCPYYLTLTAELTCPDIASAYNEPGN